MDTQGGFALDGRVAIVTGAASGIGRQTTLRLAQAGATVVGIDCDSTRLEETLDAVAAQGGQGRALVLDVTDDVALNAAFEATVGDMGRIDVLANIAGISGSQAPSATRSARRESWNDVSKPEHVKTRVTAS